MKLTLVYIHHAFTLLTMDPVTTVSSVITIWMNFSLKKPRCLIGEIEACVTTN